MRNFFGGDPYFNDVVLCAPLRSRFFDDSKYHRTLSANGGVVVVNDATYFDGNNDYLSLAEAAELEIGGGDFTLEAWIKPTGYSAGYSTYYKSSIVSRDLSNNRALVFNIMGTASSWTGLELTLFADNTTGYTGHSASYSFALNTWYHIAAMRRSGVVTLYVNGLPILTAANTRVIQDITTAWLIGRNEYSGYEYYFPGYIRDLRITKAARYIGAFTPLASLPTHGVARISHPTPIALPEAKRPYIISKNITNVGNITPRGNIVLDLPFAKSRSLKDFSKTDAPITLYGQAGIYGINGLYFDGSGNDYATIPDSTSWEFGTDSFSIVSDVIFFDGGGSNLYGTVYAYRDGGAEFGWSVYINDSNNSIAFNYGTNISAKIYKFAGYFIPGKIHRIEIRRWLGVWEIWLDGVLKNTWVDANSLRSNPTYIELGRSLGYGDSYFKGYILGLKIVKGGYPYRYSSNIKDDIYGISGVASPRSLGVRKCIPINYTYNKRIIKYGNRVSRIGDNYTKNIKLISPMVPNYNNEYAVTVSPVGNATITANSPNEFSNSWYFDGAGDYCTLSTNNVLAFGTNDFTIEFWVKPDRLPPGGGVSNDCALWCQFTNSPYSLFFLTNNSYQAALWDGTTQHTSSTTVQPFVWSHVAYCRKNNTLRIFINGVRVYTYNNYTLNFTSNTYHYFGAYALAGNRYYKGWMQVRYTPNVGRYTSNFIPPPLFYTHGANPSSYKSLIQKIITESVIQVFRISYLPKEHTEVNYDKKAHLNVFNNSYIDNSIYKRTLTTTNTSIAEGGVRFNGTSSYLTVPDSDDFYLASGDFTISFDIKPYAYNGTIFEKQGGTMVDWGNVSILITSGGLIRFSLNPQSSSNTNQLVMDSTSIIKLNLWNNVIIVRRLNTFYMFINNKLDKVTTHTYGSWNDTYPLLFGSSKSSGTPSSLWLNGIIKNFKWIKGFAAPPSVKLWTQ